MIDQATQETIKTLKADAIKLLEIGSSLKFVENSLKKLNDVNCPFEEKFDLICATDIFSHTHKTDLYCVTEGIKVLINYGLNLLAKEEDRPRQWCRIYTSRDGYSQKWENVYGSEEILRLFGYNEYGSIWEYSQNAHINRQQVAHVVMELILIRFDLENAPCIESLLLGEVKKHDENIASKDETADLEVKSKNMIDEKIREQIILFENKSVENCSCESTVSIISSPSLTEKSNEKNFFKENNDALNDKVVESFQNIDVVQEIKKDHNVNKLDEIKQNENSTTSFMIGLVQGIWKKIGYANSSCEETHNNDNNNNNVPEKEHEPPDLNITENEDKIILKTDTVATTVIENDIALKCDETLQSKSDCKSDTMVLNKRAETRTHRDGQHCDLCGSSTPAVRCEKCSNQIFCLSCDDMYHRHPKRRNHARKAVESFKAQLAKGSENEADPNRLPVPPPRRRKSQKSVPSSPLFGRKFSQPNNPPLPKKEFSFMDKVGSLRRMIGRPLPPVPKDDTPDRPPKTLPQSESSPFRRLSSSCSSYSNVSDNEVRTNDPGYPNFRGRQSPAYANEPAQLPSQNAADWDNPNNVNMNQSSYPSSLNRADIASGVQLGFQGFPTLPKRGYNDPFANKSGTLTGGRMGTPNSSSVCDLPNRPAGMQPMNMPPQTQSIQDLNYMAQMQNAPPYMNPYMTPYPMMPPWLAHPQNFYHPNMYPPPDHLKRTPSNSSMNYPCSESGFRLNSYTSMGHLHNPMAMAPFSPYIAQAQRPPSPTFSSKSARMLKAHNASGEGPLPRSGRRATHHGSFHTGRKSILDNSSSEEDYFSASDEEELRAMRAGRGNERGWQCEHCTLINTNSTRICVACCKTASHTGRSGERKRRRRDGGVKSPSSVGGGDSRPSSSLKERRPSSKTPEDMVDEMAQDLVNEMDAALKLNSATEKSMNLSKIPVTLATTSVQADLNDVKNVEKGSTEVENGIKSEGDEPQRKVEVISKGTSPPPQSISTQTNLSDNSASEEPRSGPMYRTNSRSSLIGDDREFSNSYRRSNSIHANDQLPYISSSRGSLFGGISKDPSPVRAYYDEPEFAFHRDRQYSSDSISRNDYYLNLEELIEKRRQEKMRSQGFELVRLLREAEQNNFTADDLQVAMNNCGNQNAVQWLQENWKNMVDTVVTLVSNYGRDKTENDVGVISTTEAKESLRRHKGNIWAAVTDSVETRQRKFKELQLRSDFNREEINASLTANHGNIEAAYTELNKNAMKPFHMQIWGPPVGVENESGTSVLAALKRNNFDSSPTKPSMIGLPTNSSLDSNTKKKWVEELTGGAEGVGGIHEKKKYTIEGKLEFQPNRNTPHKVNRTGSFSGGSCTSVVTEPHISTLKNVNTAPVEETYVSVQWVAENKKPQETNDATPSKLEDETVSIYSSLEELNLSSTIKPTPKFPITLDQFEDFDADDDQEPVKIEKEAVYKSLSEIEAAENVQALSQENEEAIDAATEIIFDTVRTLMNDNTTPSSPTATLVETIPAPQPLSLQNPFPTQSEKQSPPIIQPPPPPPLRTEASKKASSEFERRARMCLAEGKVSTYSQAEIFVKLIDLQFSEDDAVSAANECSEVDMALTFLQQDCELCAGKYPMRMMISMLNCIHRCCQNCAKEYYTIQIRDRNIMDAICPFCDEPDLTDDDIATEYFTNLDIVLKNLIDFESHELFQRKLRDRALMKDPNFHWCPQCSFGFIAPPMVNKLNCPACRAVTCAQCRKPWEAQHNGISCEQFTAWKEANDPEFQAKGLEKHLEEHGIDCPNCRFRYSLAKGGCMHFQCMQCKFDFCSGCGKPFKMGPKCNFSPMCIKLGLHAHHPRNCLFYLRDKDPADLQKLLTENNIIFNTQPPPLSAAAQTDRAIFKCQVMEQKEIPGQGLKDDVCGKDVEEGYAGLCSGHYVEYLVNIICRNGVDPIAIFDQTDLQQELRRRAKVVPEKLQRQTDDEYREFLCQIIQEQIPLDETSFR